jgi:hypothetical protein
MDSVIIGATAFLVSGAAIVIGCNIALTIANLRAHRKLSGHEITQIAEAIRHTESAPDSTPRFGIHTRTFHGFDSPQGRF